MIAIQTDMRPLRVGLYMPLQGFDQGAGAVGRRCLSQCQIFHGLGNRDIAAAPCTVQRPQQVAWRIGGGNQLFGQADVEILLQPAEQFDAAQTVKTEVPVKRAIQCDGAD